MRIALAAEKENGSAFPLRYIPWSKQWIH